jgi:hypothetical protein
MSRVTNNQGGTGGRPSGRIYDPIPKDIDKDIKPIPELTEEQRDAQPTEAQADTIEQLPESPLFRPFSIQEFLAQPNVVEQRSVGTIVVVPPDDDEATAGGNADYANVYLIVAVIIAIIVVVLFVLRRKRRS